jgi:hypothetical protein
MMTNDPKVTLSTFIAAPKRNKNKVQECESELKE